MSSEKGCSKTVCEWKGLAKKHLKIRNLQKIATLQIDIMAVDFGIKPAYLFDFGVPSKESLFCFLTELFQEGCVRHPLALLSIADDLLVVNPETTRRLSRADAMFLRISAVDISGHLPTPVVMSSTFTPEKCVLRESFKDAPIESAHVCSYDVDETNDCNVSTLFGLLIGYPVVYWYRKDGKLSNCLSMQTLRNFRVVGSTEETHSHTLYSFSVPDRFTDQLYSTIQAWFDDLKSKTDWKLIFRTLDMSDDTIRLPHVTL